MRTIVLPIEIAVPGAENNDVECLCRAEIVIDLNYLPEPVATQQQRTGKRPETARNGASDGT
ncbi:MAG: hypothetical protein HY057_15085 [Rhodospirillales bacterium]|nr:hypothetical protein [Rhodospirillales bacterium]